MRARRSMMSASLAALALTWGSMAMAAQPQTPPDPTPVEQSQPTTAGPVGGSASPDSVPDDTAYVPTHRYGSGPMMCVTPRGACPLPAGVTVNVANVACYCTFTRPGGLQSYINGLTSR